MAVALVSCGRAAETGSDTNGVWLTVVNSSVSYMDEELYVMVIGKKLTKHTDDTITVDNNYYCVFSSDADKATDDCHGTKVVEFPAPTDTKNRTTPEANRHLTSGVKVPDCPNAYKFFVPLKYGGEYRMESGRVFLSKGKLEVRFAPGGGGAKHVKITRAV